MKQATILLCAIFIFSACEKSAERLPANANSAENEEAVTNTSALKFRFTFSSGLQGWTIAGNAKLEHSPTGGNPGGCISGTDIALLNLIIGIFPRRLNYYQVLRLPM